MTDYKKGDRVEAKFDDKWYPGNVTTVNPTGKTCSILFDDGDEETFKGTSKLLRKVVTAEDVTDLVHERMQVAKEQVVAVRHTLHLGSLEALDKLLAKLEALRIVAMDCGGIRFIMLPGSTKAKEVVLQLDLTHEAVSFCKEVRGPDGSTSFKKLPTPKRRTKPNISDVQQPLRRGRRAPSTQKGTA